MADVRMVQRGNGARVALYALLQLWRGSKLRGENLDGPSPLPPASNWDWISGRPSFATGVNAIRARHYTCATVRGKQRSSRLVGDGTVAGVMPAYVCSLVLSTLATRPGLLLDRLKFSAMAGGVCVFHRLQRHDSNEPMQATCIDCCQRARNCAARAEREAPQRGTNPGALTSAPANAVQRVAQEADIEVQGAKEEPCAEKGRMRRF